MEENNNNNNEKEFSVDINKEELKNQTKDTVNQVKETIKNVDFKKDASATKGFVLEMIKKPFTTINDIVSEKENRFAIAVILMICFIALSAINYIIRLSEYNTFDFMSFVLSVISPVLFVLAFTVSTFLFGGKDKKSLTTMISGVSIAVVPFAIKELVKVIDFFVAKLSIDFIGYIIDIANDTLMLVGFALLFVTIKGVITQEDDDKSFRKFAVIVLVAYVILKVLKIIKLYAPII